MTSEIRTAVAFLLLLFAIGTLGYWSIEGWSPMDSLFMTLITISTVGFGEPQPLSPWGKLFTSGLILFGVGTLAYIATKSTEVLLDPTRIRQRRARREMKRMRNHVIVCGYGRMGAAVTDVLRSVGAPTIVIDKDPEHSERLHERGIVHFIGDATEDAVIGLADVEHAQALATVLPNDADNLFMTVAARELNPRMTIIARSSHSKNDSRMVAAGATRVLNPYSHGGRLMAQQLLQPSVTEFIDLVSQWGATDLNLEEVQLLEGSSLVGVALRDTPIRKEMDVIVVGARREGEALTFNPPPDLAFGARDTLIVLGRRDNLRKLARMAAGAGRDGA